MVGRKLVEELVKSSRFARVVTLGRRTVEYSGEGQEKLEQHVVDFDTLHQHASLFQGHDVGFSTLGITSTSPHLEKIDFHFPLQVARLYQQANAHRTTHFVLVTAAGVSSASWFLPMRIKGKLEDEVKALGFSQLSIFRPAQLTLEPGQPSREGGGSVGERVGQLLAGPLNVITGGRAGVSYWAVARAMKQAAERPVDGAVSPRVTLYSNLKIREMGQL